MAQVVFMGPGYPNEFDSSYFELIPTDGKYHQLSEPYSANMDVNTCFKTLLTSLIPDDSMVVASIWSKNCCLCTFLSIDGSNTTVGGNCNSIPVNVSMPQVQSKGLCRDIA